MNMGLRRRVRRALGLAMLFSLVAALATPAQAVTRSSDPAGSGALGDYTHNKRVLTTACASGPIGKRVLIVGDSITVRTRQLLVTALSDAGWSVCIDARSGQPTSAALDYYAAADAFPSYVDIIVMATGSNDIFDPVRLPAQVARARAFAGGRPLLWVTAWVGRTHVSSSFATHDAINSRRVNAVIWKQIGRTHPERVVDWYGYLAQRSSRPRMLLLDGVHTSSVGGVRRAALIVRALRSLR